MPMTGLFIFTIPKGVAAFTGFDHNAMYNDLAEFSDHVSMKIFPAAEGRVDDDEIGFSKGLQEDCSEQTNNGGLSLTICLSDCVGPALARHCREHG